MAERIIEAAGLAALSAKTESMLLIPPLPIAEPVDALTFSGGVSAAIKSLVFPASA